MKVLQCGFNYVQDSCFHVERPEGTGAYLLLIIRSPSYVTLDGHTYYIKGNNVILYKKGTPQRFAADNAAFVNDWVSFELNAKDLDFCNQLGIQFDTIIPLPIIYPLSRLVELIYVERWSEYQCSQASSDLLLQLLLIKLSDLVHSRKNYTAKISKSLSMQRSDIYRYPTERWSIDRICKRFSISPSYLHSTYKKMFGTTITADIIKSKIEYSKNLLASTNHSIAEISHMVGYEGPKHFIYIFKKYTGCTPSQYRKSSSAFFSNNYSH